MARQEPEGPVADFCRGLRRLQQSSGTDLATMARRLGYSRSQLYEILNGRISRPPEWDRLVEPLLRACLGDDEQTVGLWRQRYDVLVEVYSTLRSRYRHDVVTPPPDGAGVVPAQLPAAADVFTNRAKELAELHQLLAASNGTSRRMSIFVVSGTAGVGKTALAVRWAHQMREHFPDGQLYVNLRGYSAEPAVGPGQALDGFLRALGISADNIPADVETKAGLYRSLLDGKRLLVVLDNAGTAEQVRPLLPGSSGCLVVVTSRSRLSGLIARDGAHRITLHPLPTADAIRLLRETVGTARIDAEPEMAVQLARQCAYLPLALRISAERVVSHPHITLANLVDELANERNRLDVLVAHDDEATALRAAFFWSYRSLSAPSARLFRILSLHSGADISVEAAAVLSESDPAQVRQQLDVLTSVHLLEETGRDRYRFHDLLRVYAAERAAAEETEQTRALLTRRMLTWYLHTADAAVRAILPPHLRVPLDPEQTVHPTLRFASAERALEWCDAELTNLVAATRQAAETGAYAIAWKLPAALWEFFSLRKHWADWITTHHIGRAAALQIKDREGEGWMLNSLGSAYRELGRFDEAIDQFQRALVIRREAGDRNGEGWALYNLGDTYRTIGRFAEAVEYLRQALPISREAGERWGEGWVLNMLGDAYRRLGRFAEAIEHFRQALLIRSEVGDEVGRGWTLNMLGTTYGELGDFDKAIDCFTEALALSKDHHVPDLEGHNLRYLGDLLLAIGKADEAGTAWRRALSIFEQLGDPSAAGVRTRLAGLDEG